MKSSHLAPADQSSRPRCARLLRFAAQLGRSAFSRSRILLCYMRKLDIWGVLAIAISLFATFVVWAPFREFPVIVAVISVFGGLLAFYMRKRYARQHREEHISLLASEQEFTNAKRKVSASTYDHMATKTTAITKCPYCLNRFQANDRVMFCATCKSSHHLECWNANSGCGVFGCDGKKADNIRHHLRSGF